MVSYPSPTPIQISAQSAATVVVGSLNSFVTPALTAESAAAASASAAAQSAGLAINAQTAAAQAEAASIAEITAAGAAAAANAAALGDDVVAILNAMPAVPGAVLFGSLPTSLPSSTGVWWLNGGVPQKS